MQKTLGDRCCKLLQLLGDQQADQVELAYDAGGGFWLPSMRRQAVL